MITQLDARENKKASLNYNSCFAACVSVKCLVKANRFSMSDDGKLASEKESVGKLFVPSLIITGFAVGLSTPMLSMLTVDIARTFFGNAEPATLGLVAQIGTVNSIAEVLFALSMGFLAVRFRSKLLLLLGVVFMLISTIGSFFAPTFPLLQFFYALEGGGTVIVTITSAALIGEWLPLHKKAKVVSYTIAVGSIAGLAGIPLIGAITNFGGWQLNFLLLVLPFSVMGLLLAYFGLPYKSHERQGNSEKSYLSAFSQVLKNRSAFVCLIVGILGNAGNNGVFALAFYRQQFMSSLPIPEQINFIVVIWMLAYAMGIVASVVVGRLINRVAAATLLVVGAIGNGLFTILFFSIPNLWLALTLDMIHLWFFMAAVTAWSYLTLDQVPAFRGTMMSLRSIFVSVGYAIALAVGGTALAFFGSYQAVGIALGAIILPGVPLAYFFIKDPNKPKQL